MMSKLTGKAILATAIFAGTTSLALAQADNTNSKIAPANFSGWMTDYSKSNNGRISRDAYMQEAGKRWDAMDANRQGLTVEQMTKLYGYGPSNASNGSMAPAPTK